MKTQIFMYIDEERKVMGFAVSEIIMSAILMVLGFALHILVIAIIGMFFGVFIMRFVKEKLRQSGFSKRLFFITGDLYDGKKLRYLKKYYL